ncbi:MAG: hypothetical protein RLP09_09455 [Sandaracinaceae bacterium]
MEPNGRASGEAGLSWRPASPSAQSVGAAPSFRAACAVGVALVLGSCGGAEPLAPVRWPDAAQSSIRQEAWRVAVSHPTGWECWFDPADAVALRRAAGSSGVPRRAPRTEGVTDGELALALHGLLPAMLRAQRDGALAALAEPLARASRAEVTGVLWRALELLEEHEVEASDVPIPCRSRCRPPGSVDPACRVAPAAEVTLHRAIVLVDFVLGRLEHGAVECATGLPEQLLTWSLRTLPLAAVAAGVDPDQVLRLVADALPTLDGSPRGPLASPPGG